jgi:hypothetical protein
MRLSAFAVALVSMALGTTGPAVAAAGSEPGTAATPAGQSQNPAPAVVQALREWTGGSGVVSLSPTSRIVVDSGSLTDEADLLRESGLITRETIKSIDLDITGTHTLSLVTDNAGDGFDHDANDWAAARVQCTS